MAYVSPNFKTKKALKDAVAASRRYRELYVNVKPITVEAVLLDKEFPGGAPQEVEVYQPGMGLIPQNGRVTLEGPHYPKPHTWYAEGVMENGLLVKVT